MKLKYFLKRLLFLILIVSILFSLYIPANAAFEPQSVAAAFVINETTGEILLEHNAYIPRPPASTTKMLTSLLVIEAVERGEISLEDSVLITEDVIESVPYDASLMSIPLVPGEYISLCDLLYANMLSSDCMASNVLAEYTSGSIDEFVLLMNSRASELGCDNTVFTNPSGYPDDNMHTTAFSLYLIAAECMTHDLFKEIVYTTEYTIPATNLNDNRTIYNGNRLLHKPVISDDPDIAYANPYYYEYAKGIKTGYCSSAGYCLVSAAEKDGNIIYTVILGGEKQDNGDGTYTLTQYTETLRTYNYFYTEIYNTKVSTEAFSANASVVSAASENADVSRENALSENDQIVSAFREKQEAERYNRKILLITVGGIFVLLIILTIIIFCIKKRKTAQTVNI